MSTYICSDIHGHYDFYLKMLEAIGFSDQDHLYILGDLIDRGPKIMELIQDVMERPNVTCLIGNHELMMLDYLGEDGFGDVWVQPNNGGEITMTQFLQLPEEKQNDVIRWLGDLYLQVEIRTEKTAYLLSHSSFNASAGTLKHKECPADNVFRIVWYSPWRVWEYKPLDDYRADGRMHVTGHYPVQKIDPKEWPGSRKPAMPAPYIDFENGLVNIDLGCAYYHLRDSRFPQASLCCMDLERFEEDPGKAFMFFS